MVWLTIILCLVVIFRCEACSSPYHPVGEHCLLIDNRIRGTWSEVRQTCQYLGGDLVNLQNANILHEIYLYINEHELNDVSYWVGASDLEEEGLWIWSSDDTVVKMGTPLWGDLYGHQPNGGANQNCAMLTKEDFYYMHDDSCDISDVGVICEPGTHEKANQEIGHRITGFTVKAHADCPAPYLSIWETCLYFEHENVFSWHAARDFCQNDLGGHLATIDDANLLGAIYDHLVANATSRDYWVDGSDEIINNNWVFHDGTSVKMGTPFWTVNAEGNQEPGVIDFEHCVFIDNSTSYYFHDGTCTEAYGFICQFGP